MAPTVTEEEEEFGFVFVVLYPYGRASCCVLFVFGTTASAAVVQNTP